MKDIKPGDVFTIAGIASGTIKTGDTFTLSGDIVKNPNRRWWQIWKPKRIPNPTLPKTFVVVGYTK
jgi:hypothetical protein